MEQRTGQTKCGQLVSSEDGENGRGSTKQRYGDECMVFGLRCIGSNKAQVK